MTSALAIYGQFDQLQRAATALQKSGYFSDAKSEAQAIVKVMAGAELGLPPFASMTGIHIIQGKPALGANLLATLIENHPVYGYRVLELTASVCRIQFYKNSEACGVSEFTIEEAKRAGTKNLDKFPKNMLFARAISNGARWFTPGVFGGAPVYTPDELGADIDEDGNIIEGEYVAPTPPPAAPKSAYKPGDEVLVMGKNDEKLGTVVAVNGLVTVSIGGNEYKVAEDKLKPVEAAAAMLFPAEAEEGAYSA